MNKLIFSCVAYALVVVGAVLANGSTASAQTAILQEMYGRGVHEYYAGNYREAYDLLSAAIGNGIEDPRAYYFRGMVAQATGRPEQAESDWREGAQLEAAGKIPGAIGPALARYQGPERLKLEEIRHQARLEAMSAAAQRRQQRYGPPRGAPAADQAQQQPPPEPQPAQPQPQSPVAPPPEPPAADLDDPFADDVAGEPEVEAQDALEGAMEAAQTPPADQPAADQQPDAAAGDDPFGAGDAPAGGEDPFGGDTGGGDDPFGGDGGGGEDPFGGSGDPFGGGGGEEMEDPFG